MSRERDARVLIAAALLASWPAPAHAQPAAPPAPVVVLTPEQFQALVQELLTTAPPARTPAPVVPPDERTHLVIPNAAYLGTVVSDWTSVSAGCVQRSCKTLTPLLPDVSDPKVAIPLGVAIDAAVLWVCDTWIAPRWPHVAEGILYGLAIVRGAATSDEVVASRAARTR